MAKETDAKGIPLKADHPAIGMGIPIWSFYFMFNSFMTLVGVAITSLVIYPSQPGLEEKIDTLASLGFGWAYLGMWIIKLGQMLLGINLGTARVASRVAVPDQHVYQVKGAEGSKLGFVLMDTEGANGSFNRAQRALQNYHETFPLFAVMFLLAAFVCPFPAFVCACVYSAAKVLAALGYTSAAEGRIPGTMISLLANTVLESIVLLAGFKSIISRR